MKQGELDNAIRRALNLFDAWNDVAGAISKHTSAYYEILGVIEDVVHCGAQARAKVYRPLDGETSYGHFELRKDEDTGRLYWWGSEDGWKDATEIGEQGVLTLNAEAFTVGTSLTFIEPRKEQP